jgi:RNA polymerase sigma factor (TIGR02999 family)
VATLVAEESASARSPPQKGRGNILVMSEVTRLLQRMGQGDRDAGAALLPLVYDELRRLARGRMAKERAGHTLEATALVHEAYLRLMNDGAPVGFDSRAHFFATAAEAMRRILIEHARRKHSLKRGRGQERVDFPQDELPEIASPCADVEDLLALDEALDRLGMEHPDKAQLIKLLYFAGLSLDEAGAALGLSKTSAHRHAAFARAWLFDAMERSSH